MPGMNVLHVGKRIKPFQHWEPIYIGTNQEPLYDERLTWEGRSDKMAQGYKLLSSQLSVSYFGQWTMLSSYTGLV